MKCKIVLCKEEIPKLKALQTAATMITPNMATKMKRGKLKE